MLLLGALLLVTAIPHPRGYVCVRAGSPVEVDGRLNDAAWKKAPWSDYFVDIEGSAKPKPRFRTRMKMLWDNEFLYVAAELEEPQPWATLTAHDSVIFQDPDFEVFVDPGGDSHNYFEFEINAFNTGWDLFLAKPYLAGGTGDNTWDIPGLKTAVRVEGTLNNPSKKSRRWTVELAFPWSGFAHGEFRAARPAVGAQWRVNFSRVEWQTKVVNGKIEKIPGTKEDNWVWSPQGKVNMHLPGHWGYVQFEDTAGAVFHKDRAWAVRAELQEIYEAQLEYRKANKRWAESLAAAGFPNSKAGFAISGDGWRASLGGAAIGDDGRVTVR